MRKWKCARMIGEKTGGEARELLAEDMPGAMRDFDCDPGNEACDCYGCEGPLEILNEDDPKAEKKRGRRKKGQIEEEAGIIPFETGIAVPESAEHKGYDNFVDVEFSTQMDLDEEIFPPTYEEIIKDHPMAEHMKNKLLFVREQMQASDKAIKDIKRDAVAPFQGAITENQQRKEMMTLAFYFYLVQNAIEEARIKSLHEDPIFDVYITAANKKFLKVSVGTRQDVREMCAEQGESNVYVFAEYQGGEDIDAKAEAPKQEESKEEGAA